MKYVSTHLKKLFTVNEIVTIHYFEYEKDYKYIGEKHDFWEFVYVDKGEIDIEMGDDCFRLEQGSIAFHSPDEYHNLRANGTVAPNLIVMSFKCHSPAMEFFKRKILPLSDAEKGALATIVREAKLSFSSPLEYTFLTCLTEKNDALPGSQQLISLALEYLLISLYRNFGGTRKNTTTLRRTTQQDVVDSILNYMQEHIYERVTIKQISEAVGISKTGVSTLFKEKIGESVISHFTKMKIDISKSMIREGKYNITQIAYSLGYDSIHLFSHTFKRITGMAPTEYGKSVKVDFDAISER